MKAEFDINKLAREITVCIKIHGLSKFRIKLIIARILIGLACLIAGFGLEFKDDRTGHNQPPQE